MREVTINKDDLREVVQTNRKQHREVFLLALDGYRDRVIQVLDQTLDEARDGDAPDVVQRFVALERPTDHTADYDVVLEMIEMEVGDTVTLSQAEFRQYVKDEWGWLRSFASNAVGYVGDGHSMPQHYLGATV